MKRFLFTTLAWTACALADTGVLVPGDRQQPDRNLLSERDGAGDSNR